MKFCWTSFRTIRPFRPRGVKRVTDSTAEGEHPLRNVKISAYGCYVPPRILTNQDLEKMVDTNNEWILERTGIRERHIAGPEMATSDMAVEAAQAALEQRGIEATESGRDHRLHGDARHVVPLHGVHWCSTSWARRRVGIRPDRGLFRASSTA